MDEIEELLHKARQLATEKGYPFFCSCTDLKTGRACISIGHKDKDGILKMLTAACLQEPKVNAIIRGTFVATVARIAKNQMLANQAPKRGKAN